MTTAQGTVLGSAKQNKENHALTLTILAYLYQIYAVGLLLQ